MKKTIKALLLAVLVICTVCVMTVMASAEELLGDGYVRMYESDKATVPTERTETELTWKVEKVGEDTVLTIEGQDTTLTFNSNAAWSNMSAANIPWYAYISQITKVVIDAPITKITQACAFNKLENVHTFVIPDTTITIASDLSMPFANMNALTCFGPEGTPANTIDLRNFTYTGFQAWENTCMGKTITVLMPYTAASPISTKKLFSTTTSATFKVLKNSAGDKFVTETYPAATVDIYLPAANISVEYYTGLVIEGKSNDGITGWSLNVDTGALTVTNLVPNTSVCEQFDSKDSAWVSFASSWKNYVKDVTVAKFEKFSSGNSTTQLFLSGSTSLETVTFAAGQRLQNGLAATEGWFQGCTALKAVTVGGTLTEGVADLSGAIINSDDSFAIWLTNMFNGCSAIEKIILPTDVDLVALPASAIAGCTALKEIVIGANITDIEEGTFDAWINSTEGYSALKVIFTEENSAVGLALKKSAAGLLTVVVPEASKGGDVSGDDDNDLLWTFDGIDTLTITGTSTSIVWAGGKNAGWSNATQTSDYSMVPWHSKYKSVIKHVVIEAPVTAIPTYMFGATTNVESVILPASCKAIGDDAFVSCGNLKSVKTAGVNAPGNVIDLRNMTGSNGDQIFESCFSGEATIWLPKTATKLTLNDKFGLATTKAHFVVYPGSTGEENVYNMINTRAANVKGEITYSYYTADQDATLADDWQALRTGSEADGEGFGIAKWTFDVDTGIVTVTATAGKNGLYNCNLTSTDWTTKFLGTFKYAIKQIHFNTTEKLNAGSTINGLPELTTIIFDGTRMQGSTNFKNNPKLTTFGTDSNVAAGVVNLSMLNEYNNKKSQSTLIANMFSGCTSITKVILPANATTSLSIITIGADAFTGCTSLDTIVIPENCTITTTIDSAAFTDLTNPVKIINEAADTTLADALIAILPEGSYLYKEAASGIVFDGWQVRVKGYNGLRGVFHFDNEKIGANKNDGWELAEYGALLSTADTKENKGAVINYDAANKTTSASEGTHHWPIWSNDEFTDNYTLNVPEGGDPNDTYFGVAVVNYTKNWTTEVYMAGYEIWTNGNDYIIMYTDYTTNGGDPDFQYASIYEVSLTMYMTGFVNAKNDGTFKDDNPETEEVDESTMHVVWDTLVKGGAVTLTEGTDYSLSHAKIEGPITDLEGNENAFKGSFEFVNVPAVRSSLKDGVVSFNKVDSTISIFKHPQINGEYVLIYRGTQTAASNLYNGAKTYSQVATDWLDHTSETTVVSNMLPNPILTKDIWSNITHAVLDYGMEGTNEAAFANSGITTLVYSETFKTVGTTSFENMTHLTTAYLGGNMETKTENVVDLSHVKSINTSYLFDGCSAVQNIHLPSEVTLNTQICKGTSALQRVWIGENAMPDAGVIDLSNASAANKAIPDSAFNNSKNITTLYIPESIVSIPSNAFGTKALTIYHYTYESVDAIAEYVNAQSAKGNDYSYSYYILDVEDGWSGIIVN